MMERRALGGSGLQVSRLCFGGNVFGWTADEKTSFDLLDAFVAAGGNFVDTADVYSRWAKGHQGGESETVIGKWFARGARRDSIVLATKVGMEMAPDRKGLRKDYILRSVEESLRRLQTDHIDLYQSHRDDADTPLDETLSAYDTLIRQGKVRAIGASNYSAQRLSQALAVSADKGLPAYQCLQPLYNLYDRAVFEDELQALCLERGVGVIPFYSLASGFLTGKYRSADDAGKSARGGGVVQKYLNPRGMRILDALDRVSARLGTTPAKVALSWLADRPAVTAPIASATSLEQLAVLVDAMNLRLDAEASAELDRASAADREA